MITQLRNWRFRTLLVVLGFTSTIFAQSKENPTNLPADLALVPNDAFVVMHLKIGELWRNESLKEIKQILDKAGASHFETFTKRFTNLPSSIERITGYMPVFDFNNGPSELQPVVIFTTNKPFNKTDLLNLVIPKRVEKKGRMATFYSDEEDGLAMQLVDEQTFVLGSAHAIQIVSDSPIPTKKGPLSDAIKLATGPRPVVVGVNLTALPEEGIKHLLTQVPEPLHPLFKAESIILSMDIVANGNLHASLNFSKPEEAVAAEKSLDGLYDLGRAVIAEGRRELEKHLNGDGKAGKIEDLPIAAASLMGLGALQHAEDLIKTKPIQRQGDALAVSLPVPPQFKMVFGSAAIASGMMAPAIGRVREAASRTQSANNLKQIMLALHNYHDVNGKFPPASIVDKKSKPMLSWRVMILPYIEQDNLYKEFHLDEPWDSEHNKKLIPKMPKTYAMPNKLSKSNMTHYRVFVGNDSGWDWIEGLRIQDITDGTSNTWGVVETDEGVPWTKPDELLFDPKKDELPKLGKFFRGGFNVGFFDGSVRFFAKIPAKETLNALITKSGGEVISND